MMSISQNVTEVKSPDDYIFGDPPDDSAEKEAASSDECAVKWCHELVFRDNDFCFDHFIEEDTVLWDAQRAERETCLAGVGYR